MTELGIVDSVDVDRNRGRVLVNVFLGAGRTAEQIPFRAPAKGMWIVPEVDDVVEVYDTGNGSYAARFSHSTPEYEMPEGLSEGDIAITANGTIWVTTNGYKPVNIDHQSSAAYIGSDKSIAGDGNYYIVEFDAEEDDPEDLFNPSTHEITVRHDGTYEANATIELPTPGQNNTYTLAIFRNGSLAKRKSRQSVVNEPLSLDVEYNKRLNEDDALDVRLSHTRGSSSAIDGSQESSSFNIKREGI